MSYRVAVPQPHFALESPVKLVEKQILKFWDIESEILRLGF